MISKYIALIKTYPRYVSFSCLHTFFSALGQTFFFALFVPQINSEFGLSATESGTIYGTITLLSAFLILWSGSLIDRVNLRTYSSGVGLGLALGAALLAYAQTLWQLILAWFILRHLGQALMSLIASTATARYFTQNRGKALALKGLGIAFGEAVLPSLIVLLLVYWGWRDIYLLLALICCTILIPLSRWLIPANDPFVDPNATEPWIKQRNAPDTHPRESHSMTRKEVLSHSYFWMILPAAICTPFFATGFFYHQAALATAKGWTLTSLASMFVGYGIARFCSSLLMGPLVDRFGAIRLLPLSLVPLALGSLLFSIFMHPWAGFAYLMLIGASIGLAEGSFSAALVEAFGRLHLGSIKSLISMIVVVSTAISPPLGGWLLEAGYSITSIFIGSFLLLFLAFLLAIMANPPQTSSGDSIAGGRTT